MLFQSFPYKKPGPAISKRGRHAGRVTVDEIERAAGPLLTVSELPGVFNLPAELASQAD
jgi:hypothetical protein